MSQHKVSTWYQVYCTAGFYPQQYKFDNREDAIKCAIHASATGKRTEWTEYVVSLVTHIEHEVFNTRDVVRGCDAFFERADKVVVIPRKDKIEGEG